MFYSKFVTILRVGYFLRRFMRTISDNEFLDKVYKFVKTVWLKMRTVEGQYEYIDIGSKDSDEIFKYMVSLNQFNNSPEIMDDRKYKKFVATTFYRGVTNPSYNFQLLTDKNYHHGKGYANGIYSTSNRFAALQYTTPTPTTYVGFKKKHVEGNLLAFKLKKPNSVMYPILGCIASEIRHGNFSCFAQNVREKLENFVNFTMKIEDDSDCLHFLDLFLEDYSKIALYLGYDTIVNGQDTIVLDRSKMVVSNSEVERIKKLSQQFAGGLNNGE